VFKQNTLKTNLCNAKFENFGGCREAGVKLFVESSSFADSYFPIQFETLKESEEDQCISSLCCNGGIMLLPCPSGLCPCWLLSRDIGISFASQEYL